MRRVISLLMSLLMCFSQSVTASAKTVPTSIVQPYYEKANDAKSKLYTNDTTADCESYVRGDSDMVKITATQYLRRQGFLWTYTNTLAMSNTKTGLSSGKCRVKTVFTLTAKLGDNETITVYSDEKTVD